ncbi:MAG: hypothetical protein ACFB4I_09235 [Cyanophyceae cyanobacterium]
MKYHNREKSVVVKATVPSRLKLQFKILCAQHELNMSVILEQLLRNWLQAEKPALKKAESSLETNVETISAYVPPSLKVQLKVLCTQEQVPMRLVLSQLIEEWVEAKLETSLT